MWGRGGALTQGPKGTESLLLRVTKLGSHCQGSDGKGGAQEPAQAEAPGSWSSGLAEPRLAPCVCPAPDASPFHVPRVSGDQAGTHLRALS